MIGLYPPDGSGKAEQDRSEMTNQTPVVRQGMISGWYVEHADELPKIYARELRHHELLKKYQKAVTELVEIN